MKENGVQFLLDEKAVVEAISSGKADWGVVDSDIAESAVQAKKNVNYVVTDQVQYSTGDALGKLREDDIPTIGTPLIPSPLVLLKDRPSRVEGKQLFDKLTSIEGCLALSKVQPLRFPTHKSLLKNLEEKPAGSKKLHPKKLLLMPVTPDKLAEEKTHLMLAVIEALGSK